MILVVCPGCHRRLELADKAGGHEGTCAHCGRHVCFGLAQSDSSLAVTETMANLPPESIPQPQTQPRPFAPGFEFLAPPQQPDEIGRLGEYRVLQLLGQGAMGMVFRAEDPGLARILVLKVMLPSVASLSENRQRFLREAQATAAINHPNVIPIYKVGEDRGVPFLAMPLLKGESLETRLNRERTLSISEAVRIGREVAEGLAAAHERNLIHRDIKPANLWLEAVQRRHASDRVKILDFGLARIGDVGLTSPGAVLGTPAYMAPEQAKGLPVDHRCDLFSLGSVLYRMLTGNRAFQGTDVFAVLMALTTEQPAPPHEVNPAVPFELSQLVMHLLAKEAEDRPRSAAEVVSALNCMNLTPGSNDKVPVRSAGSSSRLPASSSSTNCKSGALQETKKGQSSTTAAQTGIPSQPEPKSRSLSIGVWALLILLICLAVFGARSLFEMKESRNEQVPETSKEMSSPKNAISKEPASEESVPKKDNVKKKPEIKTPQPAEKTKQTEGISDKGTISAILDSASILPQQHDPQLSLPTDNQRAIAEWVFAHRGQVDVLPAGAFRSRSVKSTMGLPVKAFELVRVDFSNSLSIDNSSLTKLVSLPELTSLNLSGTLVTDKGLEKLQGLSKLRFLYLSRTVITDKSIPWLKNLKKLKLLDLQDTKISEAKIRELRQALPDCQITPP